MRLRAITETLLGHHVGDLGGPDRNNYSYQGFSTREPSNSGGHRRPSLYGQPKFYQILSQKLSRLIKHDLIILVGKDLSKYAGGAEETALIPELSQKTDIPPEYFPRAITLLITGDNSQSSLSPWLILHQLGEALLAQGFELWNDLIVKKYGHFLRKAPHVDPERSEHAELYGDQADHGLRAFHHLFKMKSARDFLHGDFDNIDPGQEIMVEYLWHGGKIRMNYPSWIDRKVVDAIKTDCEEWCDDILTTFKGSRIENSFNGDDISDTYPQI